MILEGPPEPSVVPTGASSKRDPRQCYVKQLFYPGRFSIETLTKTLNIYKRSTDLSGGGSSLGKCFTCVTKTIANLSTYSRKPGDYNGTIMFEIDIMKSSSPLNLIFTFFAMSKPK